MSAGQWLLVCDIDGTLLLPEKNNPGLEPFNRYLSGRSEKIVFALNSGRNLAEIASVAEHGPIFRPDWIISDIGTVLYSGFTADFSDPGWRVVMDRNWGRAALAGNPGIVEQEPWHQHPAKLSYYIQNPSSLVVPEILRRIAPWRDECKCVVSFNYYVDIMPAWGGKGSPVEYLSHLLGIDRSRIIVAGDSGNDRDMLDCGFKTIIVANHSTDLDDLEGKPDVYFAGSPAAVGVLEGIMHFLQS